jgi:cardiolipin synthase
MTDAHLSRAAGSRLLRHLPNVITVARLVLVVPAGWLLWDGAVLAALGLVAVAGLSDAVDGILARRFDWHTRFGAIADPAADKLFVVVVFAVLTLQGHVPWWLFGIVLVRDLTIVGGALAYVRVTGTLEIAPSLLSKLNTGFQVAMLLLVIIGIANLGTVSATALALADPIGFVAVAALGVGSGIHYVVYWTRRAFFDPDAPHRQP